MAGENRPRLCFVGPHLARHAGWVTTQSEVVAELFEGAGYSVRATSSVRSAALRPLAMAADLVRWRRHLDLVMLSIYGGRAFHAADIASATAQILGLPQIHVLHGGTLPELAARRGKRMRRVLRRAGAVVAPSPFLARTAGELGIEAEVIPNVLDLDATPFRHRTGLEAPLELLWVRTFHAIYRPRLAIRVLHLLVERGLDARLTLAGQDKGELAPCRRLAADLGLADRVRFPGFLDAAGKIREFARHDLYLHTNQVDNMPVTVLEAAAFGLPILAAAVGGVPDLLRDGETGLLITDGPEDQMAPAMADAVAGLLNDPAQVDRLSRDGRCLAERSGWASVHPRWRQLFDRLLER